jgi:hypothetical protein
VCLSRDVGQIELAVDELPERRGAPMAEERALAAGEDCGHPARLTPRRAMPDGEDAAMHRQQPSRRDAPLDLAGGDAERQQLLA